jgi:hypothetical protein
VSNTLALFFSFLVEILAFFCVLRLLWLKVRQPQAVVNSSFFALILALAWVYGLMTIDNLLHIWPILGLDYSTHTALVVAGAFFLSGHHALKMILSLVLVSGYAVYMKANHYHTFMDVAITTLCVAPMCFWINRHRLV